MDWKKYNVLDFELKKFEGVRLWKNVCIQKITFWFILLRENDIFCIFAAFFETHNFEMKSSIRVRFRFERFTTRQIWDWKKYIFNVVLNASCFHFKKRQHVRVSVKNYPTIERRIDVWQLPVVHLATKSITDIVVQLSSLK